MFPRSVLFLALTLVLLHPSSGLAQDDPFDVPIGLEPAADFWKRVYSDWSEDEVVFHDRDDLSVVYRVLDQVKSEDREGYRANESEQEAIVRRIRHILLDLAARNPDPRTLSGDYEEVYEAGFEDMPRRLPDITKIQELIGYQPTRDLGEMLESIIEHERFQVEAKV